MSSTKLIVRNVRNNVRDYSIYFITLMITVALFYSFSAALSPNIFETLSIGMQNMSAALSSLVKVLSYGMAVLLAFLIIYANQFLLRRRRKELGIYMLLGMKKRKISAIFVGETFLIGLLSLLVGILAGFPLSQVFAILTLKLFGGNINNYNFTLSISSIQTTVICFASIYVLVMIFNVINVSYLKLIELLRAERKNENIGISNHFIHILCFVVSIILFIIAYVAANIDNTPIPSKANVVLIMCSITFGIILCFYSIFSIVLLVIKSNNNMYLKGLNTFLLRQIESRAHSNFISMSVVCLSLAVTIVCITSGFSIASSANKEMKESMICDMILYLDADVAGKNEEVDVLESAKDQGVDLTKSIGEYIQIRSYLYDESLTYADLFEGQEISLWSHHAAMPEMPVRFIRLSDYNACLALSGIDPFELEDDEFIINCYMEDVKDELNTFLQNEGQVTIAGYTLISNKNEVIDNIWFLSQTGNNDVGTIVIPDKIAEKLPTAYYTVQANYKSDINAESMEEVVTSLTNEDPADSTSEPLNNGFSADTKYREKSMYISMIALPVYLCLFIGINLLIICVALLALQQLTETMNNTKRYGIQRNLGANKKLLYQTLRRQIGIYFFSPLILASVIIGVAINKIAITIQDFMHMSISIDSLYTILIMILIYGGYYIITYFSCKKMILD